ncbi:MAG TPA: hypothetical protein VFR40_06250 [Lapillicoccus sp.]|nr:hypothetical protein [Lapillicoccus sp.]
MPINAKQAGTWFANTPKSSLGMIGAQFGSTRSAPSAVVAAAETVAAHTGSFTVGANSWV